MPDGAVKSEIKELAKETLLLGVQTPRGAVEAALFAYFLYGQFIASC